MPTRIPLPGMGGEALQKGVESGTNLWQQLLGRGLQQAQLQSQWQQHLRNAALREQQEERLRQLQPMQLELLRAQVEAQQGKSEAQPLNLDLLRAKIDSERAKAEKARNPAAQKETPEEKSERALRLWEEKENRKAERKGAEDYTKPTKTVITQQQNIVAAGNNLIKQLHHLMKVKSPNAFGYISPGDRATYLTEANKAADTLMATYKWLGIESSLDMAKQMTTRQLGETDDQYMSRLKGLLEEAESRIDNAENILKTNKIEKQQFNEKKQSPFEISEKNKAKKAQSGNAEQKTLTYNPLTGKLE